MSRYNTVEKIQQFLENIDIRPYNLKGHNVSQEELLAKAIYNNRKNLGLFTKKDISKGNTYDEDGNIVEIEIKLRGNNGFKNNTEGN